MAEFVCPQTGDQCMAGDVCQNVSAQIRYILDNGDWGEIGRALLEGEEILLDDDEVSARLEIDDESKPIDPLSEEELTAQAEQFITDWVNETLAFPQDERQVGGHDQYDPNTRRVCYLGSYLYATAISQMPRRERTQVITQLIVRSAQVPSDFLNPEYDPGSE